MIQLEKVKRTHPILLSLMEIHYSKPKGFVGRNICYLVYCNDVCYGAIVAGSSTRFLPGRNEFFEMTIKDLNKVINNIFFHLHKQENKYPVRNFGQKVLKLFRKTAQKDWEEKYGDKIMGFETLVELPRTGEVYTRDGWELVGQTKGYTCKRTAGYGTDNWSGKRVWDTKNLRPKLVFCIK